VTQSPAPIYLAGYLEGQKIGTITLPTLKLSWPIYEGTEEAELSKGVGHYLQSVLPGLSDNSVLAGHRNTVFNRLGELEIGDQIFIKTVAGTFIYEITKFKVVKRTDKSVIVPTEEATLTLTTCFPFNHIGITTDAFIVTAKIVQ
jgi:sortase A